MQLPLKVKIQSKGFKSSHIIRRIDKSTVKIEKKLYDIADKALEKMKEIIDKGTEGSAKSLVDSLEVTVKKGRDYWTINLVNIDKLNSNPETKYWYVLNYGKYYKTDTPFIPGRPKDDPDTPRFVPGRFVGDKFIFDKSKKGNKGIVPMRPIKGILYIEKTKNWLYSVWTSKFGKKK